MTAEAIKRAKQKVVKSLKYGQHIDQFLFCAIPTNHTFIPISFKNFFF